MNSEMRRHLGRYLGGSQAWELCLCSSRGHLLPGVDVFTNRKSRTYLSETEHPCTPRATGRLDVHSLNGILWLSSG